MRVGTAYEGDVELTRKSGIYRKRSLPGKEAQVFLAKGGVSEQIENLSKSYGIKE